MDLRKIWDDLDKLIRCLYDQPEGSVGGPLHIVTDDGNLRDSDIVSCWVAVEAEHDVVVKVICREMVFLLMSLTESQRLEWRTKRGSF